MIEDAYIWATLTLLFLFFGIYIAFLLMWGI
jgi:hypothetical protein